MNKKQIDTARSSLPFQMEPSFAGWVKAMDGKKKMWEELDEKMAEIGKEFNMPASRVLIHLLFDL